MTGRRVAAAVTGATMVALVANLVIRQLHPQARGSAEGLTLLPMVLALVLVGGFIAGRRSRNPYGWVLLTVALLWVINSLTIDLAALGVARGWGEADALAVVAVFTAALAWGTFVTFVLLLYPTGSLPSPRWRWVGWAAGAGLLFMSAGLSWTAVQTGAAEVVRQFAAGDSVKESGVPLVLNGIGHLLVFCSLLAGVAGLFLRHRRASTVERLQLKWFAFGAALVAGSILVQMIPGSEFLQWLEVASLSVMPLVIGIAITRWHLYDIDRVISRTVAYAVLTLLCVGIYLAAVTALTALTAPVTRESPVAVAVATLLAAAAFQPARRRIQSLVDQQFNRARYDARHTVEMFATSLRQEVDLDDVRTHLVGTVGDVLQPTQVKIWLRPGPAGS
jgi:hypothetical protein